MRFIHSIVVCRIRRFLAVLRSFFHSSLLYTLSFHRFPPTCLPSSVTSSCHLFLGLPLSLVVSKYTHIYIYIYYFFGILFCSILCTCPNQRNLFNLIISVIVGFFNHCTNFLISQILQFSFSLSHTGPKILLYTFLSKTFISFLSFFFSIHVSDVYVKVLSVIVFFSLILVFFRYLFYFWTNTEL
jgi:hypothetical protein